MILRFKLFISRANFRIQKFRSTNLITQRFLDREIIYEKFFEFAPTQSSMLELKGRAVYIPRILEPEELQIYDSN